jgi:NADH-quinone oxidoreductase subunit M
VLSSWTAITERVKEYYIFLLVLQTGMLGAFMALDFLLFFLFWEVMLVPMYFLIGIWGSANRLYSAIKFFLYTLVGSVVMLSASSRCTSTTIQLTGVYTFDVTPFTEWPSLQPAVVAVPRVLPRLRHQVPMFPFPHVAARRAHRRAHGRLGDSGGRAPEDGHLRVPPLQPAHPADATRHFVPMMVTLSHHRHRLRALVALAQKDWKRLVAYSSVSHMAMVMIGMFALNPVGITGSIIQQLNHGISTGALFLIVGIVYERRHTREFRSTAACRR